jgi:hypothetical protein
MVGVAGTAFAGCLEKLNGWILGVDDSLIACRKYLGQGQERLGPAWQVTAGHGKARKGAAMVQIFMGQLWVDHNAGFLARALKADRITFADLGVVIRIGRVWAIESPSGEASAFVARTAIGASGLRRYVEGCDEYYL